MTDIVMVWTTVPVGDAGEAIARVLVEERLAACVSITSPITSVYRWEGHLTTTDERQLIIKTTDERVPAVRARLAALHSYDLPEVVVVRMADGSPDYLDWIRQEVTPR